MIKHTKIENSLNFLNTLYDDLILSEDQTRAILISKLALLEFCGWLEETIDEIAINCISATIPKAIDRQRLQDKIDHTTGFSYRSMRELLTHALGVKKYNEVEKRLNKDGSLERLQSKLASLNKHRRDAAHRTVQGAMETYNSPNVILSDFNYSLVILQKLWTIVREVQ